VRIHLGCSIVINKPLKDMPAFFGNPESLVAWDKSVAKVILTIEGPLRVGYTLDTIGPTKHGRPGKRSSYEVIRLERSANEVALLNSAIFRRAV